MMTSFDYIDIAWGCNIVGGNFDAVWVYIKENMQPKSADKVEGGCYW